MTKFGFKLVCSACRRDFGVIYGIDIEAQIEARNILRKAGAQIMCDRCADRIFSQVDMRQ